MLGCMNAFALLRPQDLPGIDLKDVASRLSPRSSLLHPASLPFEIFQSAERGELQKVIEWLRNGGPVDAGSSGTDQRGRPSVTLLHTAADTGHLEIVKELLKRGASVDLPNNFLESTALMAAAIRGHLPTMRLLLQHSADPDVRNVFGHTALMSSSAAGQEACVKELLRANADAELLDEKGSSALDWAQIRGHTAITELIQWHGHCRAVPQTAGCRTELQPAAAAPWPLTLPWVIVWVVLGAIATVVKAMARARGQARAKKKAKKKKADCAAIAGGKSSGAPPAAKPAPPLAAVPKPATLAAEKKKTAALTTEAATTAPTVKVDTLERATANGGESSGGASDPWEASEAVGELDYFECPITGEIMTDPVVTIDGFTYEREAISEWLRTKNTSPCTGVELESKTLVPNHSLRSMVRSFAGRQTCARRRHLEEARIPAPEDSWH